MAEKKGKLAVIKTKVNTASVDDFIGAVEDEQKRHDSLGLLKMMEKISKEKHNMWGASMIGFGEKRYKSPASGREVDWFKIGFSPCKANISIHLVLDLRHKLTARKNSGSIKQAWAAFRIPISTCWRD